jgi:hypothetical protein
MTTSAADDFTARLHRSDRGLFAAIPAQLEDGDKATLLALQRAVRSTGDGYVYLEIGSYLGGSLQPHVADPRCMRIYSIDKRTSAPPDDRQNRQTYPQNTTGLMLRGLARIPGADTGRIRTFDLDAADVPPGAIDPRPHLCFIDGEHTREAVASDFRFCRSVLAPDGVICFHDANIVFPGISEVVAGLIRSGERFRAYVLPLHVFVIEFGDSAVSARPDIREMLTNNHVAYLAGLGSMEHYRNVYNRPLLRAMRSVRDLLRRLSGRRA